LLYQKTNLEINIKNLNILNRRNFKMKKTALIVTTALMVTLGSSMAFASIAESDAAEAHKQIVNERETEMSEKYLTDDQRAKLDELRSDYLDSISDLVKETGKMRTELDKLNETVNPDPELVQSLEKELWEKTGQLTVAKKAFVKEAKIINPAFPFAVKLF
jgi:Spy/CpxP family protein refolding chaperone